MTWWRQTLDDLDERDLARSRIPPPEFNICVSTLLLRLDFLTAVRSSYHRCSRTRFAPAVQRDLTPVPEKITLTAGHLFVRAREQRPSNFGIDKTSTSS
jgi:hypothetical protein